MFSFFITQVNFLLFKIRPFYWGYIQPIFGLASPKTY